jgi:phospholipid/cholesterol/gamma-HCH transport system substrate-binding protein
MKNERNALKAGIFMVVSLVLIIAVIVGIKGFGRFAEPLQYRTVTFKLSDDVGGLRIGDDVRIGGAKVGAVRSIDVEPDKDQPAVLVRLSLPKRFQLKEGARPRIQATLTGTAWINFETLGTGTALAENATIAGYPSETTELLAKLSSIAPTVQDIVTDVKTKTIPKVNLALDKTAGTMDAFKETGVAAADVAKSLKSKIDGIVERYNKIMETGTQAMVNIRDLFGDIKTDFRTTVANFSKLTGTLNEKLPPILDKVDNGLAKLQGTVDNVNKLLEDVKAAAANTRDITATGRSVIVQNQGKLNGMISSLKVTADNLKGASAEVRRSPWRLLYKPQPGEMGNLTLFDSARQFAEGANDMNDAAQALRDALKDPNADKEQIQKLIDHLDQSFGKFNSVEQQLWKQVKE